MYTIGPQAEQAAQLKAEKIKMALQKLKEASIRKVQFTQYGLLGHVRRSCLMLLVVEL